MTAGVDIGVYPQRHAGHAACCRGQVGDPIQFAGGLGVDDPDASTDRELEFLARLADAGEDNLVGSVSGPLRHLYLARGIGIDAAAEGSEQADDRERRVGLQRVMDRVRVRGEGGVDGAIRVPDRARAVDVGGSANLFDDRFNADGVAREAARSGRERLVHQRPHVIMRASSPTRARARAAAMAADASSAPPRPIAEIIERCLNGDQAAWDEIVRRHWRLVFNVAYKFVGTYELAEDLSQDVFLKVFKSLDTFDRRANFQTWLVSVSRNLCIDHYRSVRKERETIDRDVDAGELTPAAPGQSAYQALEQRDRVELLRKAMAELPPTLREAVVKRDIQELSYQEIADQLGLPEGTVKSRINRGRTELARQVQRIRETDEQVQRIRVTDEGVTE